MDSCCSPLNGGVEAAMSKLPGLITADVIKNTEPLGIDWSSKILGNPETHDTTSTTHSLPQPATLLFASSTQVLMKRIPIQRWGSQFPSPRARPRLACASQPLHHRHLQ